MTSDIKKHYEELKKKHSLPDYKSMDNDFEISKIDDTNFLLREISRKIIEKVEVFSGVLGFIVQPDTSSLADMHECGFFSETEKKKIFDLFKVLMTIDRTALELSIKNDEKELAKFIKDVHSKWGNIKKDVVDIVTKLKETWGREVDYKEDLGYLG